VPDFYLITAESGFEKRSYFTELELVSGYRTIFDEFSWYFIFFAAKLDVYCSIVQLWL